jgi:hypothetical protein
MSSDVGESLGKRGLDILTRYEILRAIALLAVSAAGGLALVWFSFGRTGELPYYVLQEMGKAALVTALVSITLNYWVRRQADRVEEERARVQAKLQETAKNEERLREDAFKLLVAEELKRISDEVRKETARIAATAFSFDQLQLAGAIRFYSCRDDKVAQDIEETLLADNVTSVKLIGISLNDFVRDGHLFNPTWDALRRCIRDNTPLAPNKRLDIKALVIDPDSEGAYLREMAESTDDGISTLRGDLRQTIFDLMHLEREADTNGPDRVVRFEAKAYRTSPISFLAWTPDAAFVQPYHFRRRHTKGSIPIIKYINPSNPDGMHRELGDHFDWIWKHESASISLTSLTQEASLGTATALRGAHIENMFYDQAQSRRRICQLISTTQHRLWIKGISLKSFFNSSNGCQDILEGMTEAHKRGADVRILIINPNGEQARLRSFKEYKIAHPDAVLQAFTDSDREQERLFRDTTESIREVDRLWNLRRSAHFQVKMFNSGPECFMLMTDDAVMVEQYHYGNPTNTNEYLNGLVLGGKMPVTEYRHEDGGHSEQKDPYWLLADSFEYVFKNCSDLLPRRERLTSRRARPNTAIPSETTRGPSRHEPQA